MTNTIPSAGTREQVATDLVSFACDRVAHCCGMSRVQLLARAGFDEGGLRDPAGMVAMPMLLAVLRFAQAHTRDPGLGLRLASLIDLRQLGFWGYAVLSSQSLRERIETHLRYQPLRAPWRLTLTEESETATLEFSPHGVPTDVLPTIVDWIMATALLHLQSHLGDATCALELSLSYPAQPHHRELGRLFAGRLVFDAPRIRLRAPSRLLDTALPGDPYLKQLARDQLDGRLASQRPAPPRALADQVRERIAARLDEDSSIVRVARDLGVSARTLQRQLDRHSTTFHALVEEVRREHALRYIQRAELTVQRIAKLLGYTEASSFRRAFRRWTGLPPERYRARGAEVRSLASNARKATRKVPRERARL